jgi:hypothetical protein
VRAAVRNYDVDVPANTFRAWAIGLVMTMIFSGLNMLFGLRAPQLIISSFVAQLVAYPIGCGWALVMPAWEVNLGIVKFNLNPGPFNLKEHTVIVLMSNAAYGTGGNAYFTDILVTQHVVSN